jgi:hypothetical protein
MRPTSTEARLTAFIGRKSEQKGVYAELRHTFWLYQGN